MRVLFNRGFNKVHNHYDEFMHKMKFYRIDEIKRISRLKKHERVLDIGAGTGYVASKMVADCRVIHALDESEEMLSHVEDNERIIKCLGNAMNIPYEESEFDVIILSDVLHHVEDQELLMKECRRVLEKGGRIIIHDFNRNYIKTKVLGAFEYLLFGKLQYRSRSEVEELLHRYGFQLKEVYDRGYYFMLSGELE